ncbi:ANTAR domain-containing protein [Streptomyces sp. NPDC101149]|uniref:ANTAR domain-containing protein n=1 Tax=Streptomyces sp. NPDC101149 TaxID=3366113 RepID=UPI00380160CB
METHANEFPGAVPEPENHAVGQIHELQTKVAQLERAVDSHAVIDQAIGVVVAVGRMTPAQAWDLLRETSMSTNIKLRHVAELIVTWGVTGHLVADIREELASRLNRSL